MSTTRSCLKVLVLTMKCCKEITCLAVFIILRYLLLFARASDAEGNALFAVGQALNDPNGILSSWNIDLVDPCSNWNLVNCDDKKHVISLSLAGQGFTGVLSPQIGSLQNLQTLELQNNNLSSTLPDELGNLTNLLSLDAHSNFFSGPIPKSIGRLSKLRYLILSNNMLNGAIPTEVTEISSLSDLNLSYNNLTGTIPDSMFNIPEYNVLGNHLTCPRTTSGPNPCLLFKNASTSPKQVSTLKRSNLGALVGGTVGGVLVLVALATLLIKFRHLHYRQRRDIFVDVGTEDDLKVTFGQLKRFSWRELQVATECFHEKNVLGQGGFGRVFKGVLGDGTQVAVKRLKDNHIPGGEAAFLREVEMIGVAVHRNLLNLIGFCATASERLLVYPFMANRSVAYQLRERKDGEAVLNWSHRKQIALGAARGLAYLHDHCNPRIIHRDVKAANVLLDEDFHAVVGDFGLAKLVDSSHTHVTTVVRGTMGHIAPEYLSTGKSSEKTDVFGYGIMLLELVTGQRAIDFSRLQEEDDILLLDHVKKLQHEKQLVSIVDPSMLQYNPQEVEELIQVALLCTQSAPEDRPTMPEVVRMLSGEGLAERWEEWQQVEGLRRREYDMMPQRLIDWMEDSTINLEAIELSAGR